MRGMAKREWDGVLIGGGEFRAHCSLDPGSAVGSVTYHDRPVVYSLLWLLLLFLLRLLLLSLFFHTLVALLSLLLLNYCY